MLFNCYFEANFSHKGILGQILETSVLKIKEESFVQSHSNVYFKQLLSVFHHHVGTIDKQEAKFIKAFVKRNLQYEYAVFIDS